MESTAKEVLTFDEACEYLPDGDHVHTFLGFIGADWDRAKLLDAMRASPSIGITGPMAQSMGHGLAIKHPRQDSTLFVATSRRTDR